MTFTLVKDAPAPAHRPILVQVQYRHRDIIKRERLVCVIDPSDHDDGLQSESGLFLPWHGLEIVAWCELPDMVDVP